MNIEEKSPLIFDIRHFALDDGPGIRTTVFFKGCPLSCAWCHNPESVNPRVEIAYYGDKCIGCGDCSEECQIQAIDLSTPGHINRDKCISCGCCAEICPTGALKVIGKHYTVGELSVILLRDRYYYETSKGGVTFSGGEPTLHMDYLHGIMTELKKEKIHIAIQTCGFFNLPEFEEKLLPLIDLIFFDIKIIDPEKHKKYTGVSNEKILENFTILSEKSAREKKFKIIARTPLIPGINDTEEDMEKLRHFYETVHHSDYEFLTYNPGGKSKKERLK